MGRAAVEVQRRSRTHCTGFPLNLVVNTELPVHGAEFAGQEGLRLRKEQVWESRKMTGAHAGLGSVRIAPLRLEKPC